ncbi:sulfite reductase subunit alpha [Rubripirellula reticaptiva]|uniref:assimilatory sulfite reductase (NADPH) n=1 Tax=Rubripirellula reticaptiva TaxID=2528013 RepID=A0A5C6FCZ8_9BACT|nr:sulfite reductase subunit alpha [Rubripirellula reticaptiva]TWU57471.1 Sulfite reductase [NADPH] flavoprotein alpha-component [Rubripirellula reticaptiva]
MSSFIPATAPFNEEQRAWLNGFFSGLMGVQGGATTSDALQAAGFANDTITGPAAPEEEDFQWHDSALPIVDRMELAAGKPLERKLMAAMAQLDCGSCGYVCQTYAEAIASGDESNLTLCSPGGKDTKQMIKRLLKDEGATESSAAPASTSNGKTNGIGKTNVYSRANPFTAKLIESRPLNKEGSAKDTRHVAIDLAGSGLSYHVGDALGVFPANCDELVASVIDRIGADPNLNVTTGAGLTKTLRVAIGEDYCLKDPTDELLSLIIDRVEDESKRLMLKTMADEGVPEGFDVLDVLEVADCRSLTATEFLETLDPLNPRLYSIASSTKVVGDEVHLTIGKVVYEREGRTRKGVASTMLADRVESGSSVRVFVQPNHGGFTVPADPTKPIIMVGPGTGIAPFVAFLQERAATKAPGKNWLFFGDQHEAYDFLYEDELKANVADGLLTRLDTAFSRDGEAKVYVQDRMRENAAELWQWLNEDASLYVCGDASRMAADVERALIEVAEDQGNLSTADAQAFVRKLAADGRYVRDVY